MPFTGQTASEKTLAHKGTQRSLHVTNRTEVPTVQSWERKVHPIGWTDRGIPSRRLLSRRDINKSLPGILLQKWPVRITVGALGKSGQAAPPGKHLPSRKRPKEPNLFISSETMLSDYLITALKYLSRETWFEARKLHNLTKTLQDPVARKQESENFKMKKKRGKRLTLRLTINANYPGIQSITMRLTISANYSGIQSILHRWKSLYSQGCLERRVGQTSDSPRNSIYFIPRNISDYGSTIMPYDSNKPARSTAFFS